MIVYKTKKQALEFMSELASVGLLIKHACGYSVAGIYYLKHGEYEATDYNPVRYRDGWAIDARYHYYETIFDKPNDGIVNIKSPLKKGIRSLTITHVQEKLITDEN